MLIAGQAGAGVDEPEAYEKDAKKRLALLMGYMTSPSFCDGDEVKEMLLAVEHLPCKL